ncbi:MAG: 5'-methylthioadenosine/adenosylhomocysteine nucleosidase [Eubacteriales bacterium]
MIGIIGAMQIEVDNLLEIMEDKSTQMVSGIEYVKGKIHGRGVVVAKCGIGKVFAALCTQTMILNFSPYVIVNTGVSGGLLEETAIGDVVIAKNVCQHDMDTSGIGDPVGMISGINLVHIPTSESVSKMLDKVLSKMNVSHKMGTIATGDQFISDTKITHEINKKFGAIAFDMESAAIGQVCYVNDVEYGIIRSISDNGSEDAGVDFMQFAKKAAKISSEVVEGFIESIGK